jgi:hypothetical protein
MIQKHEILNGPVSDSSFWNFLGFLIYLAAVCFGFRASNFEFTWRRLGALSFADVVLLNIEKD